jgi:ABC-type uncharacterized transport system permease subunit
MTDATWRHSTVGVLPPDGASGAAMWNLTIDGAAVVAFALFATLAFNAWQEWVNMALGIWLLISPWVLAFHASEALRWNSVIAGALIAALAAWVLVQERANADQPRAGNRYGSKTMMPHCRIYVLDRADGFRWSK